MKMQSALRGIRERRGIGAAALAERVGVSRQTIYAMEAGSYMPNTATALQLAKALEVTVEELFHLEEEPVLTGNRVSADLLATDVDLVAGQALRIGKVGKRMVAVPAIPQPFYLPPADGVALAASRTQQVQVRMLAETPASGRTLLIAGCDPGISVLSRHLLSAAQIEVVAAPCSSRQALEWLRQGKVHIAGTHLRDRATGEYNLPVVRRLFPRGGFRVVTFASWEEGLVVRRGNPKRIRGVEDLARKDVRIVNREPGAGSRDLLDDRLRHAGIPAGRIRGYGDLARGHFPAAWRVAAGDADCCLATRAAARALGLDFVPLAAERYDLIVLRRHFGSPGVSALFELLNRSFLRRKLETLAGYDTSQTGVMQA